MVCLEVAMKFVIAETQWHRCRYAVVAPGRWTQLCTSDWNDLFAWCYESFGPRGDVWSAEPHRWYANSGKLFFRDDADLTAFLLKWA